MDKQTGDQPVRKKTTWLDIFKYALGDGAFSIAMNGANNFALLYMTHVLELPPTWASLAIGISICWDALTDPVMGHISDHARTRWGRRHPFILIGGLATSVFFALFWLVPQLMTGKAIIFLTVLVINLLIRTCITVYMVPYTALGFEICPEYETRSRLQGVRFFINQVTNFIFGALAWTLFFKDEIAGDGSRIDGALIGRNYIVMGVVLGIFIATLASACVFGSRRFIQDNRAEPSANNNLKSFWADFASIFKDKLAVSVFVFFIVVQFSMMLMGTIQMFTYVFYMQFTDIEKTCVHGGGMLAFAVASLSLSKIVARFDKKPAGYIGISMAILGGLGLLAVFTGGILQPQQTLAMFGMDFPISVLVFGILQALWWGGCGLVVPLASSMIADIAAINHKKTGVLRNAAYASVFSFCSKASASIGIVLCGWLVQFSGIQSGAAEQAPEAVRNIAIMTFVSGPAVIFCALLLLFKYPVNRAYMKKFEN